MASKSWQLFPKTVATMLHKILNFHNYYKKTLESKTLHNNEQKLPQWKNHHEMISDELLASLASLRDQNLAHSTHSGLNIYFIHESY